VHEAQRVGRARAEVGDEAPVGRGRVVARDEHVVGVEARVDLDPVKARPRRRQERAQRVLGVPVDDALPAAAVAAEDGDVVEDHGGG